jgi:pyruvate/2-oxoglutarate dehydrogenase complex dihydrolipoamide acyltransferase (E2) component
MADPKEARVPDIGGHADVPVIEVLIKPGDTVEKDQSLITLESDKATMEVPAPFAGVVKEVKLKVGDEVSEGALIAIIEVGASAATPAPAKVEAPTPSPKPRKNLLRWADAVCFPVMRRRVTWLRRPGPHSTPSWSCPVTRPMPPPPSVHSRANWVWISVR